MYLWLFSGFRVKGSGEKVALSAVSFERTSEVSCQIPSEKKIGFLAESVSLGKGGCMTWSKEVVKVGRAWACRWLIDGRLVKTTEHKTKSKAVSLTLPTETRHTR